MSMNAYIAPNVRGAPKTRATSIRLKEVLAAHVGPQRARSIVEHLTSIELLPAGSRRFSVPVTAGNAAFALVTAACDAGNAIAAACQALRFLAYRRFVPGEPPGLTVLEALVDEIERGEGSEWHFSATIVKRLSEAEPDAFEVFLPSAPRDPAATELRFRFEHVDTLPAAAIDDVATMLRAAG
jgi:hypothetical protein